MFTDNLETKLKQRVNKVQASLKFKQRSFSPVSENIIKDYFTQNFWAYRLFHSWSGFLHMGISQGKRYHRSDVLVQLETIEKYIRASHASSVLELASGQGANSNYLAKRNPNVNFVGLDLLNKFLPSYGKNTNLRFIQGDFHDLAYFTENNVDIVFVIEALCYSQDKAQVISEGARVLKPGGYLIIYDGYFNKIDRPLTNTEVKACEIAAQSMAIQKFETTDAIEIPAQNYGLNLIEKEDLTLNIIPTLKRFERLAKILFAHSIITNLAARIFPHEVIQNSIAGYLLPVLIDMKIASYYKHVFQKST